MTIEETVKKFIEVYNKNRKSLDLKSNFYCGITNDLDRRKGEHNVDEFLYSVECEDFETSSALEGKLEEEGFDCGDETGHGKQDSIYVYIYRKTPNTKE